MDPHSPDRPADLVLSGRIEPDQERTYLLRGFTLPLGTSQLHVRYEYSHRIGSDPRLRGGNTLDIGIFDERGSESGSLGFRGWSGSAKDAFTIDAEWATPPYRPGPLGAGEWQILLGAYKVGPEGLNYQVSLWFDAGLEPPEEERPVATAPVRPALPSPLEPGWVRGDLHCHSLASDGDSTLLELLRAAAEAGLDFLGVTDHNAAILPVRPAGAEGLPVLVPGIEVTTYGGHWNVWGTDRWYDFRSLDREAVRREMAIARAEGGFVSVNHPRPFGPAWEYGVDLGYHAIEVWNGPWLFLNAVSLAYWDAHLRAGYRVVALGGSDTHNLKGEHTGLLPRAKLGEPTVWVRPEGPVTAASILDAMHQGRVFISASPMGPQLYLTGSGDEVLVKTGGAVGKTVALIADQGAVASAAIDRDVWSSTFVYPPNARFLRAQIVDEAGNLQAISNPIWRD